MPYINTIDINGEVYHVANLTDGEHVVDLPQLNNNDIFLVRGDIIDSLTSSVSSKPLSAKQGKILNDVISQLKADVGGQDNARKDVTDGFKNAASLHSFSILGTSGISNGTFVSTALAKVDGSKIHLWVLIPKQGIAKYLAEGKYSGTD